MLFTTGHVDAYSRKNNYKNVFILSPATIGVCQKQTLLLCRREIFLEIIHFEPVVS